METITHNHSHEHSNYHPSNYKKSRFFQLFNPLRQLVDGIQVKHYRFAHLICQTIPCCCPFERNVNLFGRTFHVPALCKFNPLYDEFVGLRFRALSYLADECGEDVTKYIC
ncbi:Mo-dependent nitrogenase C-terminal domain-containing protein [Fortiea contorta]|uniref:Mo-dependent nitrogenase C-terminal domain-containing protein n=1 Tax=Fortiea contorta TaxID=1892405 RepID=UPI000347AF33|nr:Mo-dependent nitrogenase C-terminal domain-containing protein [Fortiea contorta]